MNLDVMIKESSRLRDAIANTRDACATRPMSEDRKGLAKIREAAFARVDIASLVFFRIVFGLVNAGLVVRVLWQHLLGPWWASAPFLFNYAGFSWVKPWPGIWLQFHWITLGVFALFIAIGFLYRISTVLFFLSHTYFFLLDQGRYVNHLYLIGLFGLLFVFVPAHRAFSIDAWLNPNLHAQTVPAWGLWLFRTQMAAAYFFAASYRSLLLDLFLAPLLLWRRTRLTAFARR
ncbi:MAG: hypothetical protein DME38_14830 [Verrucomicrobia bacterium]|nr:MAG: hypothetical protein DME38_14830 [Verrucomicrobiota bacterium]